MANDPQVPWSDEQWARVNQVVQEEAKRARVAATFLPLYGPLDADADFVRRQDIWYAGFGPPRTAAAAEANTALLQYSAALQNNPALGLPNYADALAAQDRYARAQAIIGRPRLGIDDRDTMRLATLQVIVPVRNAQIADPEMTSVLALFRRAANVVARLEDAIVFRGLAWNTAIAGGFAPPAGVIGLPGIWQITGAERAEGLWSLTYPRGWSRVSPMPLALRGHAIVRAVSRAIGDLEQNGHFGPFAAVLGQGLFLLAQTPDVGSLVMPQDRIIPFLGGGPLLRSSTLDALRGYTGLVVALGGAPVELVVATDMSLQFLQVTNEPTFIFRVYEKIALRIREPRAIAQLYMR
jgi:Encapsulating protein for peroxidase